MKKAVLALSLVTIFLIVFFFLPQFVHAQCGGSFGFDDSSCLGDPDMPIDNSVWILLIAGILFGLKKIGYPRIHSVIKKAS